MLSIAVIVPSDTCHGLQSAHLCCIAVPGFSDTRSYQTERGAASHPSLLGSTANGDATLLRLVRHAFKPSLNNAYVTHFVALRLQPAVDPSRVALPAGSPVLQWSFHSPKCLLCAVRGNELNCCLGNVHPSFSSLCGSWPLVGFETRFRLFSDCHDFFLCLFVRTLPI